MTGLSDEEDAVRHIEHRFNPDLRFCPNCESIVDRSKITTVESPWCHYCGNILAPMGTKPHLRKFYMR